MRQLGLLLLCSFLLACGQAEKAASDGTNNNNPSGGSGVQIKNLLGTFDIIPISDIISVKVRVTDGSSQTTIEKIYTGNDIAIRVQKLGLHTASQKNLLTQVITGEVSLTYRVDSIQSDTQLNVTKVFYIIDGIYLQDTMFNNVIYSTKEIIDFNWLK